MTTYMPKKPPAKKAAKAAASLIPESFRALAYPTSKLKLDPNNARAHDERNLEAIERSLVRFGWRDVLVARKDGTVLKGNARLTVARKLGWTEVPVLFVDDDKQKGMAFAIADNRVAELAEWKLEELAKQVQELSEDEELLDSIGFTDAEIENLQNADWEPGDVDDEDGDLEDHQRDPVKPKGDDSRVTVVLTGAQLQVALAALDKMRQDKPRTTFGSMIEHLSRSYVGAS